MSRPARVLILAKGLGRGGAERLLTSGLAYLDRERFEPQVAYVLPWKDALVGEIAAQGVPVHCLGEGSSGRVAWPARLRRLLRRGRFDIVHTHMPSPAVAARLAVRGRRPAFVHTEHNVWERYRRATYWGNALTFNRNAAVLAVSQGVAESITRSPLAHLWRMPPVEVLIHGIDSSTVRRGPEARSEARRRLGLADDAVVLGTVANFTPKKDQATLLEAMRILVARHERLSLVLIGSGPLEHDLHSQVHQLELTDRVVWAGSRNDVPTLLPGFDVFVLSSRHEGLSIALIEALAAGLPCVATNVGGIPEVVEHQVNGLLVPPGQPAALARAIERVLTDDELRRSLIDQTSATAQRFQLSSAVRRMQEVYDSVLVDR